MRATARARREDRRVSFTPTHEQSNARKRFSTGESLAIEAGAGTVKESTFKGLGECTQRRGQYVAFNKAIVEDAKSKFPRTVACSTAHSLAFRAVGHRFKHRLDSDRMHSSEIAKRLGLRRLVLTSAGRRKELSE